MRNQFKTISKGTVEELAGWARDVNRNRIFDVEDFTNVEEGTPRMFSVPSSSTDIIGTERQGDLAVDASFLYYVANSGGSLVWRRIAGSSF